MRSFAVIAAAAGLASAQAWGHGGAASWGSGAPVYVTDVVTAYTTYCPEATQISHNGVTYTVTEATTLTITNCPCTITRPASSPTGAVPTVKPNSSALAPVSPPPAVSGTGYTAPPKPSVSATQSAPPSSYTGAANKVQVAGGVIAALGLVAAAL